VEIEYQGPENLFAIFGGVVLEVASSDGYTVDFLKKGFLTDEIVRYVVQFDINEFQNEIEILRSIQEKARLISAAITVKHTKNETPPSGEE
jgi:hypothetical protein